MYSPIGLPTGWVTTNDQKTELLKLGKLNRCSVTFIGMNEDNSIFGEIWNQGAHSTESYLLGDATYGFTYDIHECKCCAIVVDMIGFRIFSNHMEVPQLLKTNSLMDDFSIIELKNVNPWKETIQSILLPAKKEINSDDSESNLDKKILEEEDSCINF